MSFDALNDLNWLAVLVAALAYFAIGAVWYAPPVLGKVWMEAGGMTMDQTGDGPGAAIYVVPLIASVLSALALGMIASATGTDTARVSCSVSSSPSASRSRSRSSRPRSNPRSHSPWCGEP